MIDGMTDFLQEMIDRQRTLHGLIDNKEDIVWGKGTPASVLFDEIDGAIEEAVELKRVFPQHKKWRPGYGGPITVEQQEQGQDEAIDLLHFSLNCCIRLGLTDAQKLYAAFARKNDINFERQGTTYEASRS